MDRHVQHNAVWIGDCAAGSGRDAHMPFVDSWVERAQ